MPSYLIKSGHHFSLADCQILGTFTEQLDLRQLWVNGCLYIPNNDKLKKRLYVERHDHPIAGHSRTKKIFFSMAQDYYWPYMAKDVDQFCRNSAVCRRTKHSQDKQYGFLRPLSILIKRWQQLSIDYIVNLPICIRQGISYRHIVVICDQLTK